MPLPSRVKFGLALTSGGAVAVGTPVALHFTQSSDGPVTEFSEKSKGLTQVSEVGEGQKEADLQTPQLRAKRSLDRREEAGASSTQQQEETLRNEENNRKFSEFWIKITKGYQGKQNNIVSQVGNEFSFQSELKNILLQQDNLSGEWSLEREEYRDCSRITAGQTDYCSFLKLKIGNNKEYRLKIDRYGNERQHNKWSVNVVRKNGGTGVQFYSRKTNKWESSRAPGIDKFQGETNARDNWWGTLTENPIEV